MCTIMTRCSRISPKISKVRQLHLTVTLQMLEYHWDEETDAFCDVTLDTEENELVPMRHQGYLSLFPFLFDLIAEHPEQVKAVLEMLQDPERLWSEFGIRSLSKSDDFFGQGENYWRGPIWINMNYLVLRALNKYYIPRGDANSALAKEIYTDLRSNVIENIYREYQRTGTFWEQYHPTTGQGQRSHPFTGWTTLVLMMMSETY